MIIAKTVYLDGDEQKVIQACLVAGHVGENEDEPREIRHVSSIAHDNGPITYERLRRAKDVLDEMFEACSIESNIEYWRQQSPADFEERAERIFPGNPAAMARVLVEVRAEMMELIDRARDVVNRGLDYTDPKPRPWKLAGV